MTSIIGVIVGVIITLVTTYIGYRYGYSVGRTDGHASGTNEISKYWEELQAIPIAGQKVEVPGIGKVMILGRGEIDGVPSIDFIPLEVLDGRLPPELSEEELNSNTISSPLDEFVAQCEISLQFV